MSQWSLGSSQRTAIPAPWDQKLSSSNQGQMNSHTHIYTETHTLVLKNQKKIIIKKKERKKHTYLHIIKEVKQIQN